MKFKECQVKLVSQSKEELTDWIDKIKKELFFKDVRHDEIYPCTFKMGGLEGNITDYRCTVNFTSKASKNNIYWAMNQIKPNPIKFL